MQPGCGGLGGGLDGKTNVVLGSNPAGLSGHDCEQGGIFNEYTSGNAGGLFAQYTSGNSGGHAPVPGAALPPAGDPPQNPMEALAQGIAQLQTAMAMQMGLSASKPETIRPGTSGAELPKLMEADEMAVITVGDWLHYTA